MATIRNRDAFGAAWEGWKQGIQGPMIENYDTTPDPATGAVPDANATDIGNIFAQLAGMFKQVSGGIANAVGDGMTLSSNQGVNQIVDTFSPYLPQVGLGKGLLARGIGYRLNEGNINNINTQMNKALDFSKSLGSSSTSDFTNRWSSAPTVGAFTMKDIGKGGKWNRKLLGKPNKVEKIFNNLNTQRLLTNSYTSQAMASDANNVDNTIDKNAMLNTFDFGGPMGISLNPIGALGLMQQDKYFDAINNRSDAIASKGQVQPNMFSAKTFDFGGLKSSFLDEFGKDPIGAAVRYNQGLEALAAQREAEQIEAAREAEYADMQKRLLNLETENQGLQALMAAAPMTTTLLEIPDYSSTPSTAAPKISSGNATWDYIEDQLRRSGKFNDIQIEGIKYNLQRESGLNPEAVGDNGTAFGLGQWRGNRKPKDMSLEGQTQHLIDTLSNYDGKSHWIGKENYEGFLSARTPEEAHYYITKGYERPLESIVAKVKRDSDRSLMGLKAFGGELGTNGADFTNGLLYVDEGGSHEENPLEGVPMGLDPQGIPNLVEEGETVYNDYVFSDRMMVPDFMYKELGLGGIMKKKGKGMSFADASKKLAQESEQRPNDPISKAGLDASLAKLAEIQETERMRKQGKEYMGLDGYACGGKLNKYAGPGSKSQKIKRGNTGLNTYKFDPIDQFKYWDREANDYDEEYRDFIENKLNEDWIARAMSGQYGDMSRYKGANNINPTVEQAWQLGLDQKNSDWHKAIARAYDEYKAGIDPKTGKATEPVIPLTDVPDKTWEFDPYSEGWEERRGLSTTTDKSGKEQEGLEDPRTYATWMRYAPAVGSGIMSLTDMLGLTNKPNYKMADMIAAYANTAGLAPQIEYKPNGDYLRYNPMDIWYAQNRMDANARATDRAIMNNAAPVGTKMAGLLASGYNNQVANGQLYRNALEYNDAKRERIADFNRRTNMFNSQMGLEADMANARYQQAARQMGLSGLAQAAALRDAIDARVGAARSANLTNFLTSLGNIGRENFALNQINWDRSNKYGARANGTSYYKKPGAYGGKINKRK